MSDASIDLLNVIRETVPLLERISEERSAKRPAPGKWSPREILGHLVDSAANNHQRFVRGQFQADLVFTGYDQNQWVVAQRYQETPWSELVTLWTAYNGHVARVMAATPAEVRDREHTRHNFDQIGWRTFSRETPATLGDLMHDYVGHIRHHLAQLASAAR